MGALVCGVAGAQAVSLEGIPGVSARVVDDWQNVLQGGVPAPLGEEWFFVAKRPALFTVRDSIVAFSRVRPETFSIPESLSLITWVERPPGGDSGGLVFGFGGKGSGSLVVLTDQGGVPLVAVLGAGPNQFCRAASGGANVADGRRHSLAVMVNLGSGLVRLYVDGRPEAASVLSLWRPELLGAAFAAGPSGTAPVVISRELSAEELTELQAGRLAESLKAEQPLLGFASRLRKPRGAR